MAAESQVLINQQNVRKTPNDGARMIKRGKLESIIHTNFAKQSQFAV